MSAWIHAVSVVFVARRARAEEEEKLKISPVPFTCARGREEGSSGGQVSSSEQDTHNEGGAYGIGQTALGGQSGVRTAR